MSDDTLVMLAALSFPIFLAVLGVLEYVFEIRARFDAICELLWATLTAPFRSR